MDKQKVIDLINKNDYAGTKNLILSFFPEHKDDLELNKYLGLCNINLNCNEEAFKNFKFVVKGNPDDFLSLYYLAILYIGKEEFSQAESLLKTVIENREEYFDAYKSLAVCLVKQGKKDEVIALKDKMLALDPSDRQVYDIFSALYLDLQEFDEIEKLLIYALENNPGDYFFYNKLAVFYFSRHKIDKAVELYKKAIEIFDGDDSVFYNLAFAYFCIDDFENAVVAFERAIAINRDVKYLNSYGIALLKSGRFQQAVEIYSELISLSPEKETYNYHLACAYEGVGNLEEASKIIERFLSLNLQSVQLKMYLASLYSKRGMFESAKILYSSLIESGVMSNDVFYEYALVSAKTNDTDKAEEILKKIILSQPDFAPAYKDLAVIYLSRKFFDRSLEYFKKAYAIAPDNISVIFEYANYYHYMTDYAKARELYEELSSKQTVLPVYMIVRIALNLMFLNETAEAKKLLISALSTEPQNVEVLFRLAWIYVSEQNFENARQLLEDAYNLAPNAEISDLLARVYFELKQYNRAFALYSVLRLSLPDNVNVILNLAKCKFETGDYKEAKEFLNELFAILPEHEEALALLNKINEKEINTNE